ncbi:MAG: DNA recombination protein RmuC [Bacillota bacterium]|jgi:DNA recombination protein RmuC
MDWLVIILLIIAIIIGLISIFSRRENKDLSKAESRLKEELFFLRQEMRQSNQENAEVLLRQVMSMSENNEQKNENLRQTIDQRLLALSESNNQRMEEIRQTVDVKLTQIQTDNDKKLEQMRLTVDEKLHQSLERRLGESFKQVSERLELVHRGLGEMQNLAAGVGDLKKVLSNIKTRGTWGEVQLGNILEQILAPGQYEYNVAVNPSATANRVEYAVKLPGKEENKCVWLPIDAKFPLEDYQSLLQAQEEGNLLMAQALGKSLETRIKSFAQDVHDKYLFPPYTTDFAIIFLPLEGLYSELLRRPGLSDMIQQKYRIMLAGPVTIAALLNSLQMGFRTLAIERRADEVWQLLGTVKTGFSDFGRLLDKTQKKLQEASNTIDNAARKTRTIERKLKQVSQLPLVDQEQEPDIFDGLYNDKLDEERVNEQP